MKKALLISLGLLFFGGGMTNAQVSSNFYAVDTIQDIRITFEQDNWRYILDSLRYNGDDMLLGDLEINGQTFRDVGVRYRDPRAFRPGQARNGLLIDLDFINTSQAYQEHRSVNLSSALRDPSMVREVLAYEIARQYMPAPQANFARVRINDAYYGLFVNIEPIDETFLQHHYGYAAGGLFFSRPRNDQPTPAGCRSGVDGTLQFDNRARCYLNNFDMISGSGWDDFIELTRVLDKEPDKITSVLDIDNALWMLALNNVLVNLSSYTGQFSPNYFLYQRKDGRFTPIVWDLNLAFGSFKNTGVGSDLPLKALQELDPLLHVDNEAKPLIHHLLSNELHQKIYLAHVQTILRQQFSKGNFGDRARQLQEMIRPSFLTDDNRPYSEQEFAGSLTETIGERSQIPGVVSFMDARTAFLKRHRLLTVVPPEVDSVGLEHRARFSSTMITDFRVQARIGKMPRRVFIYYRFEEGAEFREARMYDDGAHDDGEANDGVFGVRIDPKGAGRTMQYYIFAENAGAASFFPARYHYEPLTANLDDLNK